MSEQHNGDYGWTKEDTARLKREMREEAVRLREEFKAEWQRQFTAQMDAQLSGLREPRSRPERGRERAGGRGGRFDREPLSRERIVDKAMEIMEKEGLGAVTMRKVAWSLDTGPASIYVHVRSMAELHGHMLDRILADLNLDVEGGDWRERLSGVLRGYFSLLMSHPEFARSALSARPSGKNYLAVVEKLLALMDEGGIPLNQASWGVDLLLQWATAGAAEHSDEEPDDQSTEWEALRTAVTNSADYPHISALGLDLLSGDGATRTAWSIQALLNGIAVTPRP